MSLNPALSNFRVAILLGGFAGALAAFVLFTMSIVWLGLVCIAVVVAAGTLVVQAPGRYWLMILLATIPIKMGKIFADPAFVKDYVREFQLPPGALPVANMLLPDAPIAILIVLALVTVMRERPQLRWHPIHTASLAAIFWALLSAVNAFHLSAALYEVLRLLQYFAVYLLVIYYVRKRADLRAVLYLAAGSIAFQAVYCVGQFWFDLNTLLFGAGATTSSNPDLFSSGVMMAAEAGPLANMKRGTGTIGHANQTAQYFEIWLPFVLAAALAARSVGLRIVMWLTIAVTLTGLVFTFSRGGAIGIAIGTLATVIALSYGRFISPKMLRGLVTLALLAGVLAAPAGYYYMTTRPQMMEDRFWLIRVGWGMVSDHPMLGVGVNQSMVRFNEYDPERTGTPERLHTYYVSLAAERGLPGVLLFLIFMLMTAREAWRNLRARDPAGGLLAAGAFGAMVSVILHMTFDLFYGNTTQLSIAVVAGVIVAVGRMDPEHVPDVLAPAVVEAA